VVAQVDFLAEDFGLRWQSEAATPLFGCEATPQSGVALRFPPQSKIFRLRLWRDFAFEAGAW